MTFHCNYDLHLGSGDNQNVGSLVPVVSRWLWPGHRTFLEVANMVVTWWIVAFCAVVVIVCVSMFCVVNDIDCYMYSWMFHTNTLGYSFKCKVALIRHVFRSVFLFWHSVCIYMKVSFCFYIDYCILLDSCYSSVFQHLLSSFCIWIISLAFFDFDFLHYSFGVTVCFASSLSLPLLHYSLSLSLTLSLYLCLFLSIKLMLSDHYYYCWHY